MNINVTGIDPAVLLMELHNNTSSPDTWACNLTAVHRDITVDEAREQLGPEEDGVHHFSDYVLGRPIKAFLQKDEDGRVYLCRADLYDRDSSPGNAESIVNKLKRDLISSVMRMNTMHQHTPGPWKSQPCYDDSTGTDQVWSPHRKLSIARVYGVDPYEDGWDVEMAERAECIACDGDVLLELGIFE